MKTLAAFDFLSHAHMHLPFNEGYLRVLRAAFPDDSLLLAASADHVANLRQQVADLDGIEFVAIDPFRVAGGHSAHNPLWGRRAARQCFAQIEALLAGKDLRLGTLLGEDANLLSVFRRRWPRFSTAPLHYILHNQLSAAMLWRSRNPLIRRADFISVLSKGLPAGQTLVTLELGIDQAVEAVAPALAGSILTLEHPILESEWSEAANPSHDGPIRVAFVGHCGPVKGFDFFVEMANRHAGHGLEFHAIGLANKVLADLDLSALASKPSPTPVPRDQYVARLATMDMVCLPVSPVYSYVASGSVIDAIAALKPVALIRNDAYTTLENAYGPIGPMVADRDALDRYFASLTRPDFERALPDWTGNLRRLRQARTPAALARGLRDAVLAD